MKFSTTMCHSHLISMLLQPEDFQNCVNSYKSTAPDIRNEGMAGYMEVQVEFDVKSLIGFANLFQSSYSYPSNSGKWYQMIRDGLLKCSHD